MIITQQKEVVGEWVSQHLGKSGIYHYQAIGLEKKGKIVGGVIVDNYRENASCSIHCAGIGKHWLNREFLFVVFDYVFRQLNCHVVINPVDSANTESVKFTSHLGFTESFRIPNGCGNSDLLVFTLRKEQCKWLKRTKT